MKHLTICIILIAALAGCTKKTDELFAEDPDVRLAKALEAYRSTLAAAPGWKLFVYPQGLAPQGIEVGGLTYYVSFPDSNRAVMVSDFFVSMAATPKESGFRLRAIQRPSLVFDTYSYIHVAADPDEVVSDSPTESGGYGWGTDFDFAFTQAEPGDTLRLKGNFNNSDAYMVRATDEEMADAFGGELENIMLSTAEYSSDNAFLYFPGTDNAKVGVSMNLFLRRVNFSYLESASLVTLTAPFSHTTYGLHLKDPVTVGGHTFQDLYWDNAAEVYYIQAAGGGRIDIVNADEPLFPFNSVLGKSLTTISVPITPLPGQSAAFATAHEQVATNLINSPYALELGKMDFIFDDESKMMALNVVVFQDGAQFIAQYVYNYSLDNSNTANFVRVGANGNGSLVEAEMAPLLDHIDDDTFILNYFTDAGPVLGQFTSLDDPAFFFTGTLQ